MSLIVGPNGFVQEGSFQPYWNCRDVFVGIAAKRSLRPFVLVYLSNAADSFCQC